MTNSPNLTEIRYETIWVKKENLEGSNFQNSSVRPLSVDPFDEGLTLETSASLSVQGGNLTLNNFFDTKFYFPFPPKQNLSFLRN